MGFAGIGYGVNNAFCYLIEVFACSLMHEGKYNTAKSAVNRVLKFKMRHYPCETAVYPKIKLSGSAGLGRIARRTRSLTCIFAQQKNGKK
jgi:hypothetical protein